MVRKKSENHKGVDYLNKKEYLVTLCTYGVGEEAVDVDIDEQTIVSLLTLRGNCVDCIGMGIN